MALGYRLFFASAVGLILLGVMVLVVFPSPDPPIALLNQARLAIDQAADAEALRYADSTYRIAQMLLKAGWKEMGRQDGRLAPFRNYNVADSLLDLASLTADLAAEESKKRKTYFDSLAHSELGELKDGIDVWREALNGSLAKLKAEGYLSSAELSLQTSRLFIEQGEYQNALLSTAGGRESLSQLSDMLAEHSNAEAQKIDAWRSWVEETLAESGKKGTYALIVDKTAHEMYLVRAGKLIHTYNCDLGYNSMHNKLFAGDGATPEGKYKISSVKSSGSKYYKALLLNYPTPSDRKRFEANKKKGIISAQARIGSFIEIHGQGGKGHDWTEGCVALTNINMDHLLKYVTMGTPVTIVRRSDQWP